MAAAAPIIVPAFGKAAKAAQASITEALTADLVVLRGTSRLSRRKHSTPLEWEFHLNPAALGVAAVGAGLTLWLLQMRLVPNNQTVDVQWGYWYSVGTNKAFPEVRYSKRGNAPSVMIPDSADGYWDWPKLPNGERDFNSPQIWYPNVPAHSEVCTWVNTKITKQTAKFAIKERKGFLNNGAGTETDDAFIYHLVGGWWSPWW